MLNKFDDEYDNIEYYQHQMKHSSLSRFNQYIITNNHDWQYYHILMQSKWLIFSCTSIMIILAHMIDSYAILPEKLK